MAWHDMAWHGIGMNHTAWQMEQYQRRVAELTAAGESWATVKVGTQVSISTWSVRSTRLESAGNDIHCSVNMHTFVSYMCRYAAYNVEAQDKYLMCEVFFLGDNILPGFGSSLPVLLVSSVPRV